MEIGPILSAMRRNKVGAVLIALQIAVTLAILCNGLYIVQQRIASSHRPSGMTEADLFAIENTWVGSPADLPSRLQADLATLRSLPGVIDAYATNEYPFTNSGWTESATLTPEQTHGTTIVSLYFGDEHAIDTLGLKLVAGRNFESTEITERRDTDQFSPASIIVTRVVADKLFPGGDAVGRSFYVAGAKQPSLIVGIVDRLQVPWTASRRLGRASIFYNSTIEPYHDVVSRAMLHYVVRAQPGPAGGWLMQAASKKLLEVSSRAGAARRCIPMTHSAHRMRTSDDRGLAVIVLGVVCACAVGRDRVWHRRPDQLLGCATSPANRHPACAWSATRNANHPALFSDGKSA